MDEKVSSNGFHPETGRERRISNPYYDALAGDLPPEIAAFQINSYPYANVVPTMSRVRVPSATTAPMIEAGPAEPVPRRSIVLTVVSALILGVILLTLMFGVASHIIH
jgi:hypothetical protein